jgi:hypothetical protein
MYFCSSGAPLFELQFFTVVVGLEMSGRRAPCEDDIAFVAKHLVHGFQAGLQPGSALCLRQRLILQIPESIVALLHNRHKLGTSTILEAELLPNQTADTCASWTCSWHQAMVVLSDSRPRELFKPAQQDSTARMQKSRPPCRPTSRAFLR